MILKQNKAAHDKDIYCNGDDDDDADGTGYEDDNDGDGDDEDDDDDDDDPRYYIYIFEQCNRVASKVVINQPSFIKYPHIIVD